MLVVGRGNNFLVFQKQDDNGKIRFMKIEHFRPNSVINFESKISSPASEIIQIKQINHFLTRGESKFFFVTINY
jgi:hypothetical protein